MGQYYKVCNIESKEFLKPHSFNDGVKLMEFGNSGFGTMTALSSMLLLSDTAKGPWAAQRIVVAGDYADEGRFVSANQADMNLYQVADDDYKCAKGIAEKFLKSIMPADFLSGRDVDVVKSLTEDPELTFEQPEDLLEKLSISVSQDTSKAVQEMMMWLRVRGTACSNSWRILKSSKMTYCEANSMTYLEDKVSSWTIVFEERDSSVVHAPRVLNFPAQAKEVLSWLGV